MVDELSIYRRFPGGSQGLFFGSLRYVQRDFMTNTTLRDRFGIEARNSATASRIIKETVQAGKIRPYDETAARKFMKYIPWWA